MAEQQMAYGARMPGKPGFVAVIVDRPDLAAEVVKFMTEHVTAGCHIERVTCDQAIEGFQQYMAESPEPQGSLL